MSSPLARLLSLRALLEESSRVSLESNAALAARIDCAQQRERESIRQSRKRVLSKTFEDGPSTEQALQRTVEWSSTDAATWRDQQLEPLAQATARRMADAREVFLERRKERRQVETILDAEYALLKAEQARRTQRELDDWFSNKQSRQRKRMQS